MSGITQEVSTATSALERRPRLLAKAGLFLGVLAAAATAATARPNKAEARTLSDSPRITHPLEYVGVTSNRLWVPDLDRARQAAQDIANMNANTVRIFEPYNMSQAVIDSDHTRLCNAAEAARESGLTLEVDTLGVYPDKDGHMRHNYVPSKAGAVSRYINFIKTIVLDLSGPDANQPGPDGAPPCVEEPLSKLIIEDFDEVDSNTFNTNTDPAQKYAFLESREIPALDELSSDINNALETLDPASAESTPAFTLVHAVGALAVGNHDPVGFLKEFDQDLKGLGVQNPDFLLAVHPYPTVQNPDPSQVEANIYQPIRDELDSAWGKDTVPVFMDEVGVSAISAKTRHLYGPRSLQAASVSEGVQAQYYRDTIMEAAAENDVVGVLTFQSQDVKNDGWPSGLYDPSGKRKDSWNVVAQTFHQALQGDFQQ